MRSVENSPNHKQNLSVSINNISKLTGKIQTNTNRLNVNNNLKFNLELLTERIQKTNTKKCLQVVYTDLKKCHRFVRFFVNRSKNVNYKELINLLNDFFKED